jgi:phosphopantothenoylcysteine decarboxylase / phosphopantothenate---cysteine ligase
MHPALKIMNTKTQDLNGKRIVIGLTGSVALHRSLDLMRELMRHGAEIECIMTKSATQLMSPELVHALTGKKPLLHLSGALEHIHWFAEKPQVHLLIIAPATASTIAKIAQGVADTPLTTCALTALGSKTPILIVPAMHGVMEINPFVKENIQKLKNAGVHFVEPVREEEKSKYPPINEIILHAKKLLSEKLLEGKKVLIINGPSQEKIDAVRVLTNNSSGKIGNCIAKECFVQGARVTLVSSVPIELHSIECIFAKHFNEFAEHALAELEKKNYDLIFVPAALNDFKAKSVFKEKIFSKQTFSLELVPNEKIIHKIREKFPFVFLCSFKAEHGKSEKELIEIGKKIVVEQKMNAVALNDIEKHEMGSDETEFLFVTKKSVRVISGAKEKVAKELVETVSELI